MQLGAERVVRRGYALLGQVPGARFQMRGSERAAASILLPGAKQPDARASNSEPDRKRGTTVEGRFLDRLVAAARRLDGGGPLVSGRQRCGRAEQLLSQ